MRRWMLLCLFVSLGAVAQTSDTVYRGLGERAGIARILQLFVPLLQADARINAGFKEVDLVHFTDKLGEQLCVVSGGPCTYSGKDMTLIHDGLDITNAQFYALAEDLQLAMERDGVAPHIQNKLLARLAPMQREIVTK
jgi:hemoglobin